MPELFPPTLDDQIACVERELRFRARVYARRVADERMTRQHREIEMMGAVLNTLRSLKEAASSRYEKRPAIETAERPFRSGSPVGEP